MIIFLLVLILLTLMGFNIIALTIGAIRSIVSAIGWLCIVGLAGTFVYALVEKGVFLAFLGAWIGITSVAIAAILSIGYAILWPIDRLWAWNDKRKGIVRPWD